MRAGPVQRELALALVAILAAGISLAVSVPRRPRPDPPLAVGSNTALAGSGEATTAGKRTACGVVVREATLGVAHPVLPCGARLYVSYGGRTVFTQVIDRGPYVPGQQLDLTAALAKRLGVVGQQLLHWSYAQAD